MTILDNDESTWEHERRGFIRCRTVGHAWFDVAGNWTPPNATIPLTLFCERCGTERRDAIDAFGDLVSRYYIKPSGYDLGKRDFKPARSDFRKMLVALRESGDTTVTRRKWKA